ncbi:bacteriorhodopsin [Pseudokineococcus basanitobsidens]|uniref:Bacteriorhodopsin n=1 Tax=Pseudokineococcus basanitobsidens TaxID=1926649 RepID=A0ABU8RPI4_9ACTN
MTAAVPVLTSGTSATFTGASTYAAWQYQLILYSFAVSMFALFAAGLYALATRSDVSKRYRPASLASALICWVATLAYALLVIQWLTGFTASADGGTYTADPGTSITPLRYMDWSVTVPLLTAELFAVCTLARRTSAWWRLGAMGSAFLMILTGYFGAITLGGGDPTGPLLVWGAISTVFFVALYVFLVKPYTAARAEMGPEARTSLRNAVVLLLSVFGAYPLLYLVPLWAGYDDAAWATTVQVLFCAADITAKAGFGVLVHKVAKLRTAEDARTQAAQLPDLYPAEVWVSGELVSLPAEHALVDAGADGSTGERAVSHSAVSHGVSRRQRRG